MGEEEEEEDEEEEEEDDEDDDDVSEVSLVLLQQLLSLSLLFGGWICKGVHGAVTEEEEGRIAEEVDCVEVIWFCVFPLATGISIAFFFLLLFPLLLFFLPWRGGAEEMPGKVMGVEERGGGAAGEAGKDSGVVLFFITAAPFCPSLSIDNLYI